MDFLNDADDEPETSSQPPSKAMQLQYRDILETIRC